MLSERIFLVCLFCVSTLAGQTQTAAPWVAVNLNDLGAFKQPGLNWTIGSDALADMNKEGALVALPGFGTAVNNIKPNNNTQLVTNAEMGDVELELDFMMSKGSNSGVYLQGRYEIQLFDSWTTTSPTASDCGGIYQRWDDARGKNREGYEGIAPLTNPARAPGLWQHLSIKFQAPTFAANGKKLRNARFREVYLNGVLVQLQSEVTGPTRSSFFNDEQAIGPLMLQGDHGNIAFRNIHYRPLGVEPTVNSGDNPILVKADGKPYLLRSFMNFGDKKLTHIISGGYPNLINFSYDLKQGALLQVWRGQFLDVTEMWHERGEPQLAKPLGSAVLLSDAPALAVLAAPNTPWPDSISFYDMKNNGYALDEARFPTFDYEYAGLKVMDKISAPTAKALLREIKVIAPPANLYSRICVAKLIENLGAGLYAVDGKSFYIQLKETANPLIRETLQGKELLIPVDDNSHSFTYSIIW